MEQISDEEFQAGIDELEKLGLLHGTGEFRPASNGELQPVYAITDLARKIERSGQGLRLFENIRAAENDEKAKLN